MLLLKGQFYFTHLRDGKVLRKWKSKNRIVNEGINKTLDCLFSGAAQIDPWYVGLLQSSPSISASDGIGDLTEFTNYTGNRKEFVETRSAQTVDNSASKASFTINADSQTIGGAFLFSAATGSAGTLLCASAFTGGDKTGFDTDDVLEIAYELTGANG